MYPNRLEHSRTSQKVPGPPENRQFHEHLAKSGILQAPATVGISRRLRVSHGISQHFYLSHAQFLVLSWETPRKYITYMLECIQTD